MNDTFLVGHHANGATPLLRSDFTDDAAWERIVWAVTSAADVDDDVEDEGYGPYQPNITAVDDRRWEDVDAPALAAGWDTDESVGYVLLADATSMGQADDPTVVYVDLYDEPGRSFRCLVGEVASIEANLAIANMDFADFADATDQHGVFRGFTN